MTVTKVESVHSIERELVVLFHRVRRTSSENARRIHPDLQPAAYAVLLFVLDHGPTRASDVADQLAMDKGTVSRQIAQLVELDLIERSCDPSDRRVQTLVPTTEGKERATELGRLRRSEFVGRLSAWSPADLSELAERLGRYNASLEP